MAAPAERLERLTRMATTALNTCRLMREAGGARPALLARVDEDERLWFDVGLAACRALLKSEAVMCEAAEKLEQRVLQWENRGGGAWAQEPPTNAPLH